MAVKIGTQNGTLVNGNMDYHGLQPAVPLTHSHFESSELKGN